MNEKQVEELQPLRGQKETERAKEINIKAIFAIIRKRLWLIMMITVMFTVIAGLYNSRPETPVYLSSTRIIIDANKDLMGTAKVMFREPIVLNQVIEELSLRRSAAQLRSQIRIDSVDGSLVTLVSVIDSNPSLAAELANTSVEVYKQVAKETIGVSNIKVLTVAEENPTPINEKSNKILYIALFAGLAIGLGLTFLLDSLDETVRSDREVEEWLELTVLGQVSRMRRKHYAKQSKKHKGILVRGETIGS